MRKHDTHRARLVAKADGKGDEEQVRHSSQGNQASLLNRWGPRSQTLNRWTLGSWAYAIWWYLTSSLLICWWMKQFNACGESLILLKESNLEVEIIFQLSHSLMEEHKATITVRNFQNSQSICRNSVSWSIRIHNLTNNITITMITEHQVGVIMGVFLLCWSPFFVINVVHAVCKVSGFFL